MSQNVIEAEIALIMADSPGLNKQKVEKEIRESNENIRKKAMLNQEDYQLDSYTKKGFMNWISENSELGIHGNSLFSGVYQEISEKIGDMYKTTKEKEEISARMSMWLVYLSYETLEQYQKS